MTLTKPYKHRKRLSLNDLYQSYSYKKNIEHPPNTIPVPYVKKDEVTDTKYSLTHKEWEFIVSTYLDILKEKLFQGKVITLPYKLGRLFMIKVKNTTGVNKIKSRDAGERVYSDLKQVNDGGVFFKLCWDRRFKISSLKTRWFWKVRLVRSYLRSFYEEHEKDFTFEHRFQENKSK